MITPNKLIECPEPGILFTRDNAMWAYHALKAARDSGQSIPEQDELCDELAGILFPKPVRPKWLYGDEKPTP
jgi:hypothetical protein